MGFGQVKVTNRGLRPATNVRVELPKLPMLSVISLGMAGSDSDDTLVLDPEETAELSLGITPVPDESLSSITGGIVVRALETAERLSYRQVAFFPLVCLLITGFLAI